MSPNYSEIPPAPGFSGDSPVVLTADQVRDILSSLGNWSGDEHQLTRTVVLPPDLFRPLLDQVDSIENAMNHRAARTDREDNSTTFTLYTQALGRVTDLDVELARRIDEAVDTVASDR